MDIKIDRKTNGQIKKYYLQNSMTIKFTLFIQQVTNLRTNKLLKAIQFFSFVLFLKNLKLHFLNQALSTKQ